MRNALLEVGLNDIWTSHNETNVNKNWFKNHIKNTLNDIFLQKWYALLDSNSLYINYRLFKKCFTQEIYLKLLPHNCIIALARFRTTNNKLPVNTLRFEQIDRNDRVCTKCQLQEIGDEFHYIFTCPYYKDKRQELLPRLLIYKPNVLKFYNLMNTNDKKLLFKLKIFVNHVNSTM